MKGPIIAVPQGPLLPVPPAPDMPVIAGPASAPIPLPAQTPIRQCEEKDPVIGTRCDLIEGHGGSHAIQTAKGWMRFSEEPATETEDLQSSNPSGKSNQANEDQLPLAGLPHGSTDSP
jgi:hypothetical protein